MTYGIVGTGAIGGFYGGILAKNGHDVHFLFNSEYNAAVEHGLIVNSVKGNFVINPINAYNSVDSMPKCDVILVALKTTMQKRIVDMIRPLLKEDSAVVLLQNGLGMEAELAEVLPSTVSIGGGMAFICSNRVAPATINHLDYGSLIVGVESGNPMKIQKFCTNINEGGIECEFVEDLNFYRWRKLVWNIPYNGMTVVLNTTTDKLMQNPASRQLVYDIMLEVLQGADACGAHISQDFADRMMDMTDAMKPYNPSMKLDYDNNRPMEIEYMYSNPIKAAAKCGVELKKIKVLEQQLRFISSVQKS